MCLQELFIQQRQQAHFHFLPAAGIIVSVGTRDWQWLSQCEHRTRLIVCTYESISRVQNPLEVLKTRFQTYSPTPALQNIPRSPRAGHGVANTLVASKPSLKQLWKSEGWRMLFAGECETDAVPGVRCHERIAEQATLGLPSFCFRRVSSPQTSKKTQREPMQTLCAFSEPVPSSAWR